MSPTIEMNYKNIMNKEIRRTSLSYERILNWLLVMKFAIKMVIVLPYSVAHHTEGNVYPVISSQLTPSIV